MAQYSSFFNAVETSPGQYDRTYNATQWAEYFATFIGNGIFATPSTNLQVNASSNFEIIVARGTAFINGYYYNNTDALSVSINPSDLTYSRITSVILELNLNNRNIVITTADGTPSPNPVAPTLVRNASIYQLCLAQITIPSKTVTINQSQITDTRLINNLCGVVASTVQELDTTTLYNQWNAGFTSWFNNIKSEYQNLSVGEITTQLTALKNEFEVIKSEYLTVNSTPTLNNCWTFNNIVQSENGYLNFSNDTGTNITNFNVNTNTFALQNTQTENNIFSVTPVTNGTDTLTFDSNVSFSNPVAVNANLSANNFNTNGTIQVNNQNLFDKVFYQSGSIWLGGSNGSTVNYTVSCWILRTALLTGVPNTTTGVLGMIGVDLSGPAMTVYGSFTIPLSGNPFNNFTNEHLISVMGINLPNIAVQSSDTPFYICGVNNTDITINTFQGSQTLGKQYIRCLISN